MRSIEEQQGEQLFNSYLKLYNPLENKGLNTKNSFLSKKIKCFCIKKEKELKF